MFEAHSQIICTIFGIKIYFYGVILAIAISVGTLVANYFGEKFFGLKKETIIDLAKRLNESNMKDENVLKGIIRDLSKITGKSVSLEKEQKIIDAIKNDKVPKNVDKFF